MPFNTAGVQFARRAANRLLRDSAVIEDQVTVRDVSGGSKTTFVARPAPVPAGFAAPADVEAAAVAGQVENRAAVVLKLPWDTHIDEGARVTAFGRRWTVVALLTLPSTTAAQVRVLIREAT